MSKNILKYFFAFAVLSLFAASFALAADSKVVWFKSNPHCETCVTKIENAYKQIDGVEETHVCLEAKTVKLTYNSDKTNEATLKQTLTDLGYKAELGSDADCCKAKKGVKKECDHEKTGASSDKAAGCSKDAKEKHNCSSETKTSK